LCDIGLIRRDLARAELACRKSLELGPEQAVSHYNMATLHLLRGDRDAALASLTRDVELGDRDAAYLEEDPVFAPLHTEGRFREILNRMRSGE
jgi:Flp pilus assembly protein TadD